VHVDHAWIALEGIARAGVSALRDQIARVAACFTQPHVMVTVESDFLRLEELPDEHIAVFVEDLFLFQADHNILLTEALLYRLSTLPQRGVLRLSTGLLRLSHACTN